MTDSTDATPDAPEDRSRAVDRSRLTPHALNRTIVIEAARLIYVPTLKASCTSILWGLAELAGLPPERFLTSAVPAPVPSLTIHDMRAWGDEFRLFRRSDAEVDRFLTEDGWFRFTVVRDPASRLYSAWQSKLLAREPNWLQTFGDRAWFPRRPERAEQVLADYHIFLAALEVGLIEGELPRFDPSTSDAHWIQQTTLLAEILPHLEHVGRVEAVENTLGDLDKHLIDLDLRPLPRNRSNRSPLGSLLPPVDSSQAAFIARAYRADYEAFGYLPPSGEDDPLARDRWHRQTEAALPALNAVIDRHERLAVISEHERALVRKVGTLQRKEAEYKGIRKSLDRLASQLEKAHAKIDQIESSWSEDRVALDVARTNHTFVRGVAQKAEKHAQAVERRLAAMEASTSWRVTAPFRRLTSWARRTSEPTLAPWSPSRERWIQPKEGRGG